VQKKDRHFACPDNYKISREFRNSFQQLGLFQPASSSAPA
jgi:hypothetical protein